MNLLLVFSLKFFDKRSTFSRENKQRHEATLEFFDNEKEVLLRFELGSLDSKSKVLTTTPLKLMNLLLVFSLKFFDKRSTFSRENKQRHEATLEFFDNEKEVLLRFELGCLDSESKVLTTTP